MYENRISPVNGPPHPDKQGRSGLSTEVTCEGERGPIPASSDSGVSMYKNCISPVIDLPDPDNGVPVFLPKSLARSGISEGDYGIIKHRGVQVRKPNITSDWSTEPRQGCSGLSTKVTCEIRYCRR